MGCLRLTLPVRHKYGEEVKPATDYISRSEFEAFKEEVLNSQKKRWDSNTKKLAKEG